MSFNWMVFDIDQMQDIILQNQPPDWTGGAVVRDAIISKKILPSFARRGKEKSLTEKLSLFKEGLLSC